MTNRAAFLHHWYRPQALVHDLILVPVEDAIVNHKAGRVVAAKLAVARSVRLIAYYIALCTHRVIV